jgi:hypothetical protein
VWAARADDVAVAGELERRADVGGLVGLVLVVSVMLHADR